MSISSCGRTSSWTFIHRPKDLCHCGTYAEQGPKLNANLADLNNIFFPKLHLQTKVCPRDENITQKN